jgi:hypothetical protein
LGQQYFQERQGWLARLSCPRDGDNGSSRHQIADRDESDIAAVILDG